MKHLVAAVTIAVLAGIGHPPALGATAGNVKITLHYTGKGKVDASHKLWVWLFDTPNISAQAMPIDQLSIDKNDTEVVFAGVAPSQVWIAAAFDEQGAMTGDAPPPTGTPIGLLTTKEGAPVAVSPGEKGIVTLTFNDTLRMP